MSYVLSQGSFVPRDVLPISLVAVEQLSLESLVKDWVFCWVLNWGMQGGPQQVPLIPRTSLKLKLAQQSVLKHLSFLAQRWCVATFDVAATLADPLLGQLAAYDEVMVVTAHTLFVRQVLPNLPPIGTAAQIDPLPLVGEQTRQWLNDPSLMLLPEGIVEHVPSASFMVGSPTEYVDLVSLLSARGLLASSQSVGVEWPLWCSQEMGRDSY
eukprot:3512406-Amphidinium_carterae.2